MANPQPKSRPEPPRPERAANPQPGSSVYGGQWGSSGKQNDEQTGKPDRPGPISVPHNET
jgi:hypothetical protein